MPPHPIPKTGRLKRSNQVIEIDGTIIIMLIQRRIESLQTHGPVAVLIGPGVLKMLGQFLGGVDRYGELGCWGG
jgi:hypothetical protein